MVKDAIKNDTIVAIATPHGEGGIGVVRLSGPASVEFLKKVFKSNNKNFKPESHKSYYGDIIDPESGEFITDRLLYLFHYEVHPRSPVLFP